MAHNLHFMDLHTRTGGTQERDVRNVLSSQFGIRGSELRCLSVKHHSEKHFKISGPHDVLNKLSRQEGKCPRGWTLFSNSLPDGFFHCVKIDITYSDDEAGSTLKTFMSDIQQPGKLSLNYSITTHKVESCKFYGYSPSTSLIPMLKVDVTGDNTPYANNCDQFRTLLVAKFPNHWIVWSDNSGIVAFKGSKVQVHDQ